ncbi:PaaX family transcriptional regulator C-terminal domain-containing protein [Streptomyces narbonensis]
MTETHTHTHTHTHTGTGTHTRTGTTGDAGAVNVPTRTLVHALVREDGTVDAGELYTVAGLLGMTDQQVRLCVKRLVAEGRFTHEGRGRKAVLRAVADFTGALAPDAAHVRLAYRQDHGLAPWDGVWHLFAFAVPEAERAARDALRDTLLHLGAAPLQGGLYVCAHAIGPLIEARAEHLGIAASLTCLTSTRPPRRRGRRSAGPRRLALAPGRDRRPSRRPRRLRPVLSRPPRPRGTPRVRRAAEPRGPAGRGLLVRDDTGPAAARRAPPPRLAGHTGPAPHGDVLDRAREPPRTGGQHPPPAALRPLRGPGVIAGRGRASADRARQACQPVRPVGLARPVSPRTRPSTPRPRPRSAAGRRTGSRCRSR